MPWQTDDSCRQTQSWFHVSWWPLATWSNCFTGSLAPLCSHSEFDWQRIQGFLSKMSAERPCCGPETKWVSVSPFFQTYEEAKSLKIRMPGSSDVRIVWTPGALWHSTLIFHCTKWVSGISEGWMCLVEVWGINRDMGEPLYFYLRGFFVCFVFRVK